MAMKKGGDGKGKDGKRKEMGKGKAAGTLHETVRIYGTDLSKDKYL